LLVLVIPPREEEVWWWSMEMGLGGWRIFMVGSNPSLILTATDDSSSAATLIVVVVVIMDGTNPAFRDALSSSSMGSWLGMRAVGERRVAVECSKGLLLLLLLLNRCWRRLRRVVSSVGVTSVGSLGLRVGLFLVDRRF